MQSVYPLIVSCLKVGSLSTRSPQPWIRMAEAFERSGRFDSALSALDEAIQRAEGAERKRLVGRHARLAARAGKAVP